MNSQIYIEPRKKLIEWVRRQLIGPASPTTDGPDLSGILPTVRFPCGALYPTSRWGEGIDPAGEEVDEAETAEAVAGDSEESTTEPAIVRRYVPPSSLALSFFIHGDDIRFQVLCSAVRYESTSERDELGQFTTSDWVRRELATGRGKAEEFVNITAPDEEKCQRVQTLEGYARLDIQWRRIEAGWIVTVSLCNAQVVAGQSTGRDFIREHADKTLFEAGIRCVIDAGKVGGYPIVDRSLLDQEEQEINLRFSRRKIYAIGHGCAANWKVSNGTVVELRSEMLPAVEVPQMTADTGSGSEPVLSMARLASIDDAGTNFASELGEFIGRYENWVADQQRSVSGLPADDQKTADRMVKRMKKTVLRMKAGLSLLEKNDRARLAFALANRAMLDQMLQSDHLQEVFRTEEAYRWRPFQLAFLLTALESTANDDSEFRDTVDLIWFPTGGGKTEAYLGLIAFQIMLRRLDNPDTGGGTAILMRYTLRLLTRDQFQRATRLICALELIREQRNDLGTTPITIGMWVGDATSPNTFQKANELVNRAVAGGEQPDLVLSNCPWCRMNFKADRNFDSSISHFRFLCRNPECKFGASPDGVLPCNIVDEALYEEVPTMLVATADKFARLAWEERANIFFGGDRHLPPALIIQDELHLIAGALGSVAGLYEAAIDTVIRLRGKRPKYIASTATIRMAQQQVERLYGRRVAVFPPPGLDCDDSWFARTVPQEERPGRIHVGYLAPLRNRQQGLVPLAAALLSAPVTLFANDKDASELMDAWWTQVVYHGSLKGVGNSHTAFAGDVRDYMRLLAGVDEPAANAGEWAGEVGRPTPRIAQLTSRQTAAENAEIFSRLSISHEQDGSLDAVLATNMISVGLDVGRLALMIINGQPLTTAEYIQAGSRVGRAEVPGVVFVNYYRDQARSLSHYESFRPYHEAFHRYVEPTSVTPYAYQTRRRALHAALVIVMRHAVPFLLGNEAAAKFDPEHPQVSQALEEFKHRCKLSAPDKINEVNRHILVLAAEWRNEVNRCLSEARGLAYRVSDNDNARDRLLYNHGDRIEGLWRTLQSLRNVENSALLKAM